MVDPLRDLCFRSRMSKSIRDLTPNQLRRAARLKERIHKLQGELDQLLSGNIGDDDLRPKRNITEAGRARIVAAQKRRWAKKKRAR